MTDALTSAEWADLLGFLTGGLLVGIVANWLDRLAELIKGR